MEDNEPIEATTQANDGTTLVIDGTGKTGRRVAERLAGPRNICPHRVPLRVFRLRLGWRIHVGRCAPRR
ncbi:hypothetical protein GCM10011577_16300 [Pseudarthrobacter polychromogenes]|uniref:Uncharacterized protein n=1 Tax=Pseudarthrobacter polychromogenes TaxID=1676 RepID=A0ABQ1XI29_9MICC|nr:hypothetical protein GCM10011577_16300 [Pseudarthrobacter polychromogenes]